MELIHKEKYKGYKIKIYPDRDAHSPDDWGNNDIFLVYGHRQFTVHRKGFEPEDIFQDWARGRKTYDGYFMIPVEAYIHSGVSLAIRNRGNFPDRQWDVSFMGFALIKRVKGTYSYDKAEKRAQYLIDEWNQYLEGDVYGYVIPKLGDSCWGYYGLEYTIEAAKEVIDYHIGLKQRQSMVPENQEIS